MKRSEIIDMIENEIGGYMNPTSSRRISEKLLDKLEAFDIIRRYEDKPRQITCLCGNSWCRACKADDIANNGIKEVKYT